MTIDSTGTTGINRIRDATGDERAALEGMLKGYPVDQLVEEVLIAWNELAARNEEMVSVKQRLRVLELDLAEREDMVAPEVARLAETDAALQESEAKVVHLERVLGDVREELASQQSSLTMPKPCRSERRRKLVRRNDQDPSKVQGGCAELIGRASIAAAAPMP